MPPEADSRPSATRAKRTRCTSGGCRKLAVPGRKRCADHKPGARRPPARPRLLGRTEPLRFTPPLRPLTRKTTRGYEIIEFAEMIGEPLLPWQQWVVIHAMELNPDGSYRFRTVLILVARQNGKSHLKRIVTLWRMYMDGATRIIGVAQDVALARDQWQMCQETIHGCPDLEDEWESVRNVNGDEYFKASAARYAIKAANRRAGRGGSNDEVNIDELREQQDWKAWAAVSKTTMARAKGQLWAMSNAGDDTSVVLNQLHTSALTGADPSIFLAEYSAPEGCELDDTDGWAHANPGLGHIITEGAIRSALGTDPPAIFRTEVLCQRVESIDAAVDQAAWKACADPSATLDGYRDRIVAGFDISPDSRHCTLLAGAKTDAGPVRLEAVASWATTDAAYDELPLLLKRINPQAIGWFPVGPAAAFAPLLRPMEGSVELTGAKAIEACMGLADAAAGGRVLHSDDPLINAHVYGAQKLPSGDGWRFTRRGGAGHVDAAYAAAAVVKVALELPERKVASIRVISY